MVQDEPAWRGFTQTPRLICLTMDLLFAYGIVTVNSARISQGEDECNCWTVPSAAFRPLQALAAGGKKFAKEHFTAWIV